MSRSGSSPIAIENGRDGRRHSVLSDFLSGSVPFSTSFIDTGPNVQEILTRDIQDCSSEEEDEDDDSDSESRSIHATDVQLAFHPNGVAYGSGFSTVPVPGRDVPVPNPHEVDESLQAELDLLHDNDIVTSKHPRTGWRATFMGRLYRSLFSTRVQDHKKPIHSPQDMTEATPLLPDMTVTSGETSGDVTPTLSPDEVHKRWEEAVAAHDIKTTWQREAKTLVTYAAPLIATFLLHYSVTVGSVLTVGRLGMEELAAVNRECGHPKTHAFQTWNS